jgi:hypothetical protein
VIEDLDGAMPEPTRRWHVVALSAATAALSLVLLIALVMPASLIDSPPLATSPAASASPGPRMIISSRPPISHMRIDLSRAIVCSDGTRLDPPYWPSVDDSTGWVSVGQYHDRSGELIGIPVPVIFRFDARTGFMIVTCATDDNPGQWESDAR